ncbi:MAG: 50S ribosomal protein L30 [Candidatus Firestonebacteria bacterium]|nr:50S ribosomal protein L30 [Candidatus Firestonebacteria bacterium]
MSGKIKVTLERSIIGSTQPQRLTVRALGLKKRGSSHVLPDRAEIRGMIYKVRHLLKVEDIAGA